MISTINKPAIKTVTRETVTTINYILINTFVDRTFKSGTFKSNVLDHFPVIFLISSVKLSNKDETLYVYKRFVIDEATAGFNISLYQNNWKEILEYENINEAYTTFLEKIYI